MKKEKVLKEELSKKKQETGPKSCLVGDKSPGDLLKKKTRKDVWVRSEVQTKLDLGGQPQPLTLGRGSKRVAR